MLGLVNKPRIGSSTHLYHPPRNKQSHTAFIFYLPMLFPRKYLLLIHVIGWLFFISLPLVFILGRLDNKGLAHFFSSPYYWLFVLVYLIIFYGHSYVLAPKLFFQKKYLLYLLSIALLATGILFIRPFDRLMNATGWQPNRKFESRMMVPPPNMQSDSIVHFNGQLPPKPEGLGMQRRRPLIDIISAFLFIMLIAISFATIMARQWREAVQQAAQAEANRANAELSFLKAQINPHFLFNTLNNIYSMAVTKNNETANSIMKLSSIMRYVTDEVHEEFVSLQSEVDCINNYIELQRLRLGKKVNLDFTVTGILDGKKIAPLILMTFIENVFKYGLSNHEESTVTIKLFAEEKDIVFMTQNRVFSSLRKVERTGIGIGNTKKRLEHSYPNKHVLNITRENELFTVQLTLQDLKQQA